MAKPAQIRNVMHGEAQVDDVYTYADLINEISADWPQKAARLRARRMRRLQES